MKKVIGYCRVSTRKQVNDGCSLELQHEKITAYCQLHDLNLIGIAADKGRSGKNTKRPGLQSCLNALESGDADAMVIYRLDRIGRSLSDWDTLVVKYFKDRFDLCSVCDHIDTSTASGRMALNILMAFAQYYREDACEKTQAAADRHRQHRKSWGNVPFGFNKVGKDLVPNEDEQHAIHLMWTLREAHTQTMGQIVAELKRLEIPTKTGRPWTRQAVYSILRSERRRRAAYASRDDS